MFKPTDVPNSRAIRRHCASTSSNVSGESYGGAHPEPVFGQPRRPRGRSAFAQSRLQPPPNPKPRPARLSETGAGIHFAAPSPRLSCHSVEREAATPPGVCSERRGGFAARLTGSSPLSRWVVSLDAALRSSLRTPSLPVWRYVVASASVHVLKGKRSILLLYRSPAFATKRNYCR